MDLIFQMTSAESYAKMNLMDVHTSIGQRVVIPHRGDIAIYDDLRKYIYNSEDTILTLERVTKGGRVIVRDGKFTASLAPRNIELYGYVER